VRLNCAALTVSGDLKLKVGGTEVIVSGGNICVKGAVVKFTGAHNCDKWHRI
jgi:formylmethanofuran dehydrogenase subunit C